MRGAHDGHGIRWRPGRIIPADAGSTAGPTRPKAATGDHPRGCGEHTLSPPFVSVFMGSSPRMRGALRTSEPFREPARIIPADAGSTRRDYGSQPVRQDHPRGCGEHCGGHCTPIFSRGSSPRMRGALGTIVGYVIWAGIIPADAGSTLSGWHSASFGGSSPRMRGALRHMVSPLMVRGIIPADAGSTRGQTRSTMFASGSSPRMRGAPSGPRPPAPPGRIIPADAGSTGESLWAIYGTGDHPRGCGEHIAVPPQLRAFEGSSPRMRGAHEVLVGQADGPWIIPADAGSTRS